MNGPILVVDDEPVNLGLLNEILGKEYRLVFARSFQEMMIAAHKHSPSLVLLDVEMPEIDGLSACRALKTDENLADVPVIFVTSRTSAQDEADGFAAGAVDYITKPLSAPIVRARVRTHLSLTRAQNLEDSYYEAVKMLGLASMFKDSDTGAHIWRMGEFAAALARANGWSEPAVKEIKYAALMHDIGKLGIPDAILLKPSGLDENEFLIMRAHCAIGFDILSRGHGPLLKMAAIIALSHHERWDGTGYPFGLAGDQIPEMGRIVAIADVFDALSCQRPYKEAWSAERVLTTMRAGAGSHFDPHLLDLFMDHMPEMVAIQAQFAE
jgi:putative two-component system response regulator